MKVTIISEECTGCGICWIGINDGERLFRKNADGIAEVIEPCSEGLRNVAEAAATNCPTGCIIIE